LAWVFGVVVGGLHGDEDAAVRILRGVGNIDGISGQVGAGNLDIAAGLEMLGGLLVESERYRRAMDRIEGIPIRLLVLSTVKLKVNIG
jgi:hypothetical protein